MTLALIAWLTGLYRTIHDRVTADTEQASEPEGYLSYRAEWHAAAWGFSTGFLYVLSGEKRVLMGGVGWVITRGADRKVPERLPYPKQFARESLYVIAHVVPGIVAGILVRAGLSALGVPIPPLPDRFA